MHFGCHSIGIAVACAIAAFITFAIDARAQPLDDEALWRHRREATLMAHDTRRMSSGDLRGAIRFKRHSLKEDGRDSYRYISAIARLALIQADSGDLVMADRGSAHALARLRTIPPATQLHDFDRSYWVYYIKLVRAHVLTEIGRLDDAAALYEEVLGSDDFFTELQGRIGQLGITRTLKNGSVIEADQGGSMQLIELVERHAVNLIRLVRAAPRHATLLEAAYERFNRVVWPTVAQSMSATPGLEPISRSSHPLGFLVESEGQRTVSEPELPGLIEIVADLMLEKFRAGDLSNPLARSDLALEWMVYAGDLMRQSQRCDVADKLLDAATYVAGSRGRHAQIIRTKRALCLLDVGRYAEAYALLLAILESLERAAVRDAMLVDYQKRSLTEHAVSQQAAFGLIEAAWHLWQQGQSRDHMEAAFRAAQLQGRTSANLAVAFAALRPRSGDSEIATAIRDSQTLAQQLMARDGAFAKLKRIGLLTPQVEPDYAREYIAQEQRLFSLTSQIVRQLPHYNHLATTAVATSDDVARSLDADEAVVVFSIEPQQDVARGASHVFAVTRDGMVWRRIGKDRAWFRDAVDRQRCGMDVVSADGARCRELTGQGHDATDGGLPAVNLDHAHALYLTLLGPVAEAIAGKRLMIVPSGPLEQLPFQSLLTARQAGEDRLDKQAWLGASRPLSVLPAVTSLSVLRKTRPAASTRRAYIGIGNPLLDGTNTAKAAAARARGACAVPPAPGTPVQLAARRGTRQLADTALIKTLEPLPETADEVCEVAGLLEASAEDVLLGARATETALKRASASGALTSYRIVHFATHGAMAGELRAELEPGLILTPPATASEADDGYLSASEILTLQLDADVVILSACNTAAGGEDSAEALSGLARGFFFAGARKLLVSHWYVDSDATVGLITTLARRLADTPAATADVALQEAISAQIRVGGKSAHPAVWAPFVLVGTTK